MSDSAIDTAGAFAGGGEGGKQIRLPKKNIQTEYLISSLLALRDFDAIIKDMKRTDDPRFIVMARQIINRVLDDEIKFRLLDAFDQRRTDISKSTATADEKALEMIFAAQDAVGEVNSYYDEFFALHKGQIIGDV